MTRIHGLGPLPILSASIALLCAAPVAAETDLGELLVTDFDHVVLDGSGSPYVSQGASIGNPAHTTSLPPSAGELVLGEYVEWTNTGRFWVGSHFGFQVTSGTVTLESNSLFNNFSTEHSFPDLPNDVRIGQNGAGTVFVKPQALWINEGVPNQVSFTIGDQGFLDIQGELLSNASSVIDGGTVEVRGLGALWQVGGFGLDLEGYEQAGTLRVSDGGQVTDMFYAQVGFSDNHSGQLFVGDAPVFATLAFDDEGEAPARSLFAATILELGVFSGASGYVQIDQGGRVDVGSLLRLGRAGGSGDVVINAGGEMLVGGFYGGGFFGQSVELWSGSRLDLRDGGKLVIGTNTLPLNDQDLGAENAFEAIDAGTLLVGNGGELRGTGLVLGNVLVSDGGVLAPGHSPGLLVIDGDLALLAGSVLQIEIAGSGPGEYDQLDVSGLLTLGGVLELSFIDDFSLGDGESFELDIFLGALAGSFDEVVISGFGRPLHFDLAALLTGQATTFTAVPVPAAVWLFASALGLLGTARRTRRA